MSPKDKKHPVDRPTSRYRSIDRLLATAYLPAAKDYVTSRVTEIEARAAATGSQIATFTLPGENQREVALLFGAGPAWDDEAATIIHNRTEDDPKSPGRKILHLSAWIINATTLSYGHEIVNWSDKDKMWETPYGTPFIANFADEDEDKPALHLYMSTPYIWTPNSIPTDQRRPTQTAMRFLLEACDALLICNDVIYNEHVTRLSTY